MFTVTFIANTILTAFFSSIDMIETKETSIPWPTPGHLTHEQLYLQNQGVVMTDTQFRY